MKPVRPERLAQLQGVEWLFGFMERYPKMFHIHAGSENEFFKGMVDIHVHANPDSLGPRSQDLVDIAIDYARVGSRAILHKDHHYSTVGVAYVAQRFIDHLVESGQLQNRIEVYGGVPLAYTVDPRFVETAAHSEQMRMIFMNCIYGEILVRDGKVLPKAEDIIRLAADRKLPITICPPNHSIKYTESDYIVVEPLVECIAKYGGKVLLDHPVTAYTLEENLHLAQCGAYLGIFCYPTIPDVIKAPVVDPELTKTLIDAVGPERCVLGSDKGHLLEPDALAAMRLLLRLLLTWNYTPEQIYTMASGNAETLLFA